jgi:hypothetical protein
MPKSQPPSGSPKSLFDSAIVNKAITNKDIILGTVNPLVFALSSTVQEVTFSKPFTHQVNDQKNQTDQEKTAILSQILNDAGIMRLIRSIDNDALLLGNGVAEYGWEFDQELNWYKMIELGRRPIDTFSKKRDQTVPSTALRWKGIYELNGHIMFDQTIGNKSITLNPEQMLHIGSPAPLAPDGPGIMEYLASLLTGARFAWNKIFDVMDTQLTPEEWYNLKEDDTANVEIIKRNIEYSTGRDKTALPGSVKKEPVKYYDRLDVLDFYHFFEEFMKFVVFPTAALNSGDQGALLDSSSSAAKSELFFKFIDSRRSRIAEAVTVVGQRFLRLNGFKDFKYQFVAPSVLPRNNELSLKVMTLLAQAGAVNANEMRSWANSIDPAFNLETSDLWAGVVVMGSTPDERARSDALISSILQESFQDAAQDSLMPLVKEISDRSGVAWNA